LLIATYPLPKQHVLFNYTVMDLSQAALEYFNILADITIGKNIMEHYVTVALKIDLLNHIIDNKKKKNEQCDWIILACYQYYRLQDMIRTEAIKQ